LSDKDFPTQRDSVSHHSLWLATSVAERLAEYDRDIATADAEAKRGRWGKRVAWAERKALLRFERDNLLTIVGSAEPWRE
jgi:hypothetical protein